MEKSGSGVEQAACISPVLGSFHHDRARLGLVGLHALGDDPLGLLLKVDVDREHDVGAVLGLGDLGGAPGDGRATQAGLHNHLAVGAGENVVVVVLRPEAGALAAHEAQDARAGAAVGVDALGVLEVVDAREALVGELLLDLVGDVLMPGA